jgi:redox-sensitive bicupin YhaK (pirin superfamily)
MIKLRTSRDRGHFQSDWLDSYHSFSFDTYHDPAHMGFRTLRVINQDRVAAGSGFPLHPHRDMEILSFVLSGALKHQDSLGHEGVIRAGEVQRISAGSGISHSEFNPSETEEVHFLQIWILPDQKGLAPSYEQRRFNGGEPNTLRLIASRDGHNDSAVIHQDVSIFSGQLSSGAEQDYLIQAGRHIWLQLVQGQLLVNGHPLSPGDGIALSQESRLQLEASSDAHFLLFDLN